MYNSLQCLCFIIFLLPLLLLFVVIVNAYNTPYSKYDKHRWHLNNVGVASSSTAIARVCVMYALKKITNAHTSATAPRTRGFPRSHRFDVWVYNSREEVPASSRIRRGFDRCMRRGLLDVAGGCVAVRGDRGNASKTETVAQVQLSGSPLTSEGLLFPKVRHDYFYY